MNMSFFVEKNIEFENANDLTKVNLGEHIKSIVSYNSETWQLIVEMDDDFVMPEHKINISSR